MRRTGFTLIEIMAALAILAVGLTSIIAIVTGSVRLSNNAADRNVTRAILNEAIADIERTHLITEQMSTGGAFTPPPEDVGSFIETVTSLDPALPTIHSAPYRDVLVGGKSFDLHLSGYCSLGAFSPSLVPADTRTLIWPFGNNPKFLGGPLSSGPSDPGSYAYRVIYRLERDPRWVPHSNDCADYTLGNEVLDSPYAGLYQLTLAVYRDVDRKGGRLEQLTDPMVVFLRDRKIREARP